MHVIVLTKFNDAREGVVRNEGDIFEVAPDRYEEIMAYRADLVQVFEPEPEAEPEPKKTPTRKRKTN